MSVVLQKPRYRIWVKGLPQSFQKKRLDRYKEQIREAARQVVSKPLRSFRIDLDIWFEAHRSLRADVDNVLKPILDALVGIAYHGDNQVRSVRVVALPIDETYCIEYSPLDVLKRLSEGQEFLINVYTGVAIPASRL